MPIETAADLAVFLDVDEFGTTATINGSNVAGILMDGTEEIPGPYGAIEIIENRPVFLARSADITASGADTDSNNAAAIAGTSYTIREIRPDGVGITVLELQEIS